MRRLLLRAVAAVMALAFLAPGCSLVGAGGGSYEVIAFFPRAISVYPSSQVKVLGLAAGTVKDVEVVGDRVKITLSIHDDIPLPADVQAALVPQSLIGERFVQLTPAWKEGQPQVEDGHVIEKTIIPVEPDEALAVLKEFLDSLDPDGVGRLVTNLAEDLEGNGKTLGSALDELSTLVQNLAENEDEILAIIDNFDEFTATLVTRDEQLAAVLDAFASATETLADERESLERLLEGLADVSGDGLDLVVEHGVRLRRDIEILTRLGRSIDVNLDAVGDLLSSAPAIGDGFTAAFNEDLRAIDLRQSFSPLVAAILDPLFESLGVELPSICVPVDVACSSSVTGQGHDDAVGADLATPATPIDDLVALLNTPTVAPAPQPSDAADPGFLDSAARMLIGVGP